MEMAEFKDRVLKSGSVSVVVALLSIISGPVNATWLPIGPAGISIADFDGFATGSSAATILYGASPATGGNNGAWKLDPAGPTYTGWVQQMDPKNT